MTLKTFYTKYFNNKSAKKVRDIVIEYWNSLMIKNHNTIEWLSSPYIGHIKITITDSEKEDLYHMLDINPDEFMLDIRRIKGLVQSRKVSTEPFNILCILIMKYLYDSSLPEKQKREALQTTFYIMGYRIIVSAYSNYFEPPIDLNLAKRVLDMMSNKYDIKALGSNMAVLESKSKMILPKGVLDKKFKRFSVDDMVYIANAISGYLRGTIKSAKALTMSLKEQNEAVDTISIHLDTDDGETLKIAMNTISEYYNIGKQLIISRDDFINNPLIDIMVTILPGVDDKVLIKILEHFSREALDNPRGAFDIIDTIVDGTIEYLFKTNHYPPYDESLPALVKYLKSYWSNSKVKNPYIIDTKKRIQSIIISGVGIKRKTDITKYSILVPIYIFLRIVLYKKMKG